MWIMDEALRKSLKQTEGCKRIPWESLWKPLSHFPLLVQNTQHSQLKEGEVYLGSHVSPVSPGSTELCGRAWAEDNCSCPVGRAAEGVKSWVGESWAKNVPFQVTVPVPICNQPPNSTLGIMTPISNYLPYMRFGDSFRSKSWQRRIEKWRTFTTSAAMGAREVLRGCWSFIRIGDWLLPWPWVQNCRVLQGCAGGYKTNAQGISGSTWVWSTEVSIVAMINSRSRNKLGTEVFMRAKYRDTSQQRDKMHFTLLEKQWVSFPVDHVDMLD